jgi:large subunit ribosomal protein L24
MVNTTMKTKIKKDDEVKVLAGKNRGKTGRVLKIDNAKGRVLVEGINMVKKAMRKKNQNDRGGIVEIEAPLAVSNVAVICKKCGPTKIGLKVEGKEKKRYCRKCGETL